MNNLTETKHEFFEYLPLDERNNLNSGGIKDRSHSKGKHNRVKYGWSL